MPFATQILYNLYNYDIPSAPTMQGRYHRNPNVIDTGVVIVDETAPVLYEVVCSRVDVSAARPASGNCEGRLVSMVTVLY